MIATPVSIDAQLPTSDSLADCIDRATYRQVRDLSVNVQGGRVSVSGRSRSFYVKQLVTRAVQTAVPHARLSNNVLVCG
ncbi:MAG: hypothetical protein ACE5KM_04985 [Planctomycetaceae bacterium]